MSLIADSVLVLNKFYLAVQVTVVKDSITALVTGKARAVDENYTPFTFKQWIEFTKRTENIPEISVRYG